MAFLPRLVRPHFSAAKNQPPQTTMAAASAAGDSMTKAAKTKVIHQMPEAQNPSGAPQTKFTAFTPTAATNVTAQKEDAASRIDALENLDMGDSNSLTTITSGLNDSDSEVRKAAVEAAIQWGSRDVIPALQDAIARTDDPAEKVSIQKAIDFIKLPSVSEAAQNPAADSSNQ